MRFLTTIEAEKSENLVTKNKARSIWTTKLNLLGILDQILGVGSYFSVHDQRRHDAIRIDPKIIRLIVIIVSVEDAFFMYRILDSLFSKVKAGFVRKV